MLFEDPSDLLLFLPKTIDALFTTKDLSETMGISSTLAQKVAYCLREAEMVEVMGKRERFKLYKVAEG
jgi:transcription initiation factor IIE alpha subunit